MTWSRISSNVMAFYPPNGFPAPLLVNHLPRFWPLIPELHAHGPVVARPIFAVRAVVRHLGLVLGGVHGPGVGYASQPGGPVEAGGEQDVVQEQVFIWHQRRDEVIEDGAEALRR